MILIAWGRSGCAAVLPPVDIEVVVGHYYINVSPLCSGSRGLPDMRQLGYPTACAGTGDLKALADWRVLSVPSTVPARRHPC
jgi:hypothetical protein